MTVIWKNIFNRKDDDDAGLGVVEGVDGRLDKAYHDMSYDDIISMVPEFYEKSEQQQIISLP